MKKITTLAASVAIISSFAMTTANASENPFGMQKISINSQVAMSDSKCGGDKGKEGKCGDSKGKKEGKCGEGKCGAGKK